MGDGTCTPGWRRSHSPRHVRAIGARKQPVYLSPLPAIPFNPWGESESACTGSSGGSMPPSSAPPLSSWIRFRVIEGFLDGLQTFWGDAAQSEPLRKNVLSAFGLRSILIGMI